MSTTTSRRTGSAGRSHIAPRLRRVVAAIVLVTLIASGPVAALLAGPRVVPDLDRLRSSWTTGVVDERALLDVGVALFAILWIWFTLSAASEAWRVLQVRRIPSPPPLMTYTPVGRRMAAADPPSIPSGLVRRLVRLALVSTSLATTIGVSASSAGALGHTGSTVESIRTEPGVGAVAAWSGGSSPSVSDDAPVSTRHVAAGESYWSIAEDQLASTGPSTADVADLTRALVEHNAPRFDRSDPTLLLVGDVVEIPSDELPPVIVVSPAGPANSDGEPAPTPDRLDPIDQPPPSVETEPVGVPGSLPELPSELLSGAPAGADERSSPPAVPGDPTPSATSIPSSVPTASISAPDEGRPMSTTLGGTVLLAAGALGLLESRRRQQLRHATSDSDVEQPSTAAIATERTLRSLGASERVARLELSLRSIAHLLAGSARYVVAVRERRSGELVVHLDGPAPEPSSPWRVDPDPTCWRLPSDVPTVELASSARRAAAPCPALAHLGAVQGADAGADEQLYVDLEALGVLHVVGDRESTRAILASIAAGVAASPLAETVRLVTHGVDIAAHLGSLDAEAAPDLDTALDLASTSLGAMPTSGNGRRTFHRRGEHATVDGADDAFAPVVVVSHGGDSAAPVPVDELRSIARSSGHGIAVVVAGRPGDPEIGRASRLASSGPVWRLDPLGVDVVPIGLDSDVITDLAALLDAAERPARIVPQTRTGRDTPSTHRAVDFHEPEWSFVVRLLGRVAVVDRADRPVEFDRGRSLELLAWLATHECRRTRTAARTAMWEVDVRPATFTNVVSDARRSLARALPPPGGQDWIARTTTDELPLHPAVVSDASLLRHRLDATSTMGHRDAIEVLQPGLDWVTDLPFAGTSYLWPDAEGITTSLILLVTGAAAELARHHLALGDVDGVFRATGQGLLALPGHEELIGLRMRAHAEAGDLAGVRGEWDVYRRAVAADAWSNGDPSPKLVSLHRELLGAR